MPFHQKDLIPDQLLQLFSTYKKQIQDLKVSSSYPTPMKKQKETD